MNNIIDYVKKGINHYNDEIEKLETKSTKSTKYMYNSGALDALTNMLKFCEAYETARGKREPNNNQKMVVPPKAEVKEEVRPKIVKFEAAVPFIYEYKEEVYKNLIKNNVSIITELPSGGLVYVGDCRVGISGGMLCVRGNIEREYVDCGKNHLTLKAVETTPIFVLECGEMNLNVV